MKNNPENENWPVCPECIGLNGSIKRNWMESHSEFIVSTYETMGFDYTCHYFNSKPETMLRFLQRHDRSDKKLIRQDEITRNRVTVIDNKVYEILKELQRQDVTITDLLHRGYQLTDIMIAWHKKQAELNDMMVGFLEALTPNFTERISTPANLEAGPTLENLSHNDTKRIKPGLTFSVEVGRVSVSNRKTGNLVHSRSQGTRFTLRNRYEQSKSRRRGRV